MFKNKVRITNQFNQFIVFFIQSYVQDSNQQQLDKNVCPYLYILKKNGHKGHLFKHCALD